jgi:hypothetical protein
MSVSIIREQIAVRLYLRCTDSLSVVELLTVARQCYNSRYMTTTSARLHNRMKPRRLLPPRGLMSGPVCCRRGYTRRFVNVECGVLSVEC